MSVRPKTYTERKCKSEHIHFPEDLMKLHDYAISLVWNSAAAEKLQAFFQFLRLLEHCSPLFLSERTFALLFVPTFSSNHNEIVIGMQLV